jgi:hypothetical protein
MGNGDVPPDLQVLFSEAVHLPPSHTEIMTKWSSESCAQYAFMICKHITSTFTYCLLLLHNTCVSTWICVCVCVYIWPTHLKLLYAHTAAHIQHIVMCYSFTVDITTVWSLFVKLVIPVSYCKIKLSKRFNKTKLFLRHFNRLLFIPELPVQPAATSL